MKKNKQNEVIEINDEDIMRTKDLFPPVPTEREQIVEMVRITQGIFQTMPDATGTILGSRILRDGMEEYGKNAVLDLLDELAQATPSSKQDIVNLKAFALLTKPVKYLDTIN